MNENNMNYTRREEYETEIDLLNLLGHILIKWKLILAVAIVCAIIGGLIGYVRSGKSNNVKTSGGEEAIAAAAEGLSEVQKAEAEKYYEQMVKYDQAVEDQKKMYDESYYINLDPYTAVGCHLWYMLETDLGSAASVYSDMLTDDDYRKIADVLGSNIKEGYMKEVVTFLSEQTMDTYRFDLTNTDRQQGDIRNEYKLLFKVTITAPDRAKCDKIAQIADDAVMRETKALEKYGADIKCTKLTTRTYDTDVTERIIGNQQGKIVALSNLETSRGNFYNNVVARVDEGEKAYFDVLYNAPKDDGSEETQEKKLNSVSWKKILKYIIVVAFAGVFAVVCLLATIYIFGGKLHVPNEVNGMGIPVLQKLNTGSQSMRSDVFSKWGSKLMGVDGDDTVSFQALMEEIGKKTEQGIKFAYIAIDRSSTEALEYAQKISNGSNENVKYYIGGIVPNGDDMKHLLESDSVLLLPVIELTRTRSIAALADICLRNGIRIIGSAPVMTGAR